MITDLDWGAPGARTLAAVSTVVVVVDVLSFTTTLTVAADHGIAVRPYPWRDPTAAAFARDHDATLAAGRHAPGPISLSPATIRAAHGIDRLVLPSPNGSAISSLLAEHPGPVLGVSLRNAPAAAARIATLPPGTRVAVIASGEHRPDGSLRPAVEDLWGAGAFLHHLPAATHTPSPEAGAAIAAYERVADNLRAALRACVSGRELIGNGFPQDVDVAAESGASTTIPTLRDGWYS